MSGEDPNKPFTTNDEYGDTFNGVFPGYDIVGLGFGGGSEEEEQDDTEEEEEN
jgi:hypothetical protein